MVKKQELIWSPYQKKLFWEIQNGVGHVIVEARAGSAKTTSIIESFKYIGRGKKTIALAFNKDIAKELRERGPSYVDAMTFHSLGMQAIQRRFGTVELDDYKVFNIAKEFPQLEGDNDLIMSVCDTVAFCKYGLIDVPSKIDALISRFDIDTAELPREDFIRIVIQTLGKDKILTSKIDYNDMCWFPFVHDIKLPTYDMVFLDERQDLNFSQCYLAKKVCKKEGGRIIATGDSKQNLYGWRLSDSSIIEKMKEEETTKTLYLPISYRCPQKIIGLVKPWVPDITCPESAKEGSIEEISFDKMFSIAKPGCFILSRTNAPLIKTCLTFIREGVKANIKGRDVGRQLLSTIKRSKKKQIPAFLKWLEQWKMDEIEALRAKGFGIESLLDRCECLTFLCEESSSMEDVKEKIDDLFNDADEKKVIILSTVHRAKGKERDIVFLLHWTFNTWFDDIDPDNMEEENEENNIAYVASTGCNKLYLVSKS